MSSWDHLTDPFGSQFTSQHDHFVYRKFSKGAAYRLTAIERDEFIQGFRSAQRLAHRSLMAFILLGFVAIMGIMLWWDVDPDDPRFGYAIVGLCLVGTAGYLILIRRAYGAVDKALAHRLPVAPPLSRDEAKRNMLARMSYGQLAAAAGISVILPFGFKRLDPFHGWGRAVWLIPLAMIVVAMIQAYRKWRMERSTRG